VPPAACPHQRTPIAPSWPPRIIAVTSEIRTGQRQELFFEVPYRVRRWLIPITLEQSTSSPARNEVQPPPRSVPSYARDAIGRQLRAEYPVEQFMPARLANLLSRFEYQGRAA
jgi:hypothetical protein